jgi:hypothetical protein
MSGISVKGGCLCGAVRYEATAAPLFSGFCHCRDCQRASGAANAPFLVLPRAAVTIIGETRAFVTTGASGKPTARNFCPACGATVFGETEIVPDLLTLYAGGLDDPGDFKPDMTLFNRDRLAWDKNGLDLRAFDGMPG